MPALYLMKLANRMFSVVCGSLGIFSPCESFVAGPIAVYAIVFLLLGTLFEFLNASAASGRPG